MRQPRRAARAASANRAQNPFPQRAADSLADDEISDDRSEKQERRQAVETESAGRQAVRRPGDGEAEDEESGEEVEDRGEDDSPRGPQAPNAPSALPRLRTFCLAWRPNRIEPVRIATVDPRSLRVPTVRWSRGTSADNAAAPPARRQGIVQSSADCRDNLLAHRGVRQPPSAGIEIVEHVFRLVGARDHGGDSRIR